MELSRVVKPPVITNQNVRPGRVLRIISHVIFAHCLFGIFLSHFVAVSFFSVPGVVTPRLSSLEPSARNH